MGRCPLPNYLSNFYLQLLYLVLVVNCWGEDQAGAKMLHCSISVLFCKATIFTFNKSMKLQKGYRFILFRVVNVKTQHISHDFGSFFFQVLLFGQHLRFPDPLLMKLNLYYYIPVFKLLKALLCREFHGLESQSYHCMWAETIAASDSSSTFKSR